MKNLLSLSLVFLLIGCVSPTGYVVESVSLSPVQDTLSDAKDAAKDANQGAKTVNSNGTRPQTEVTVKLVADTDKVNKLVALAKTQVKDLQVKVTGQASQTAKIGTQLNKVTKELNNANATINKRDALIFKLTLTIVGMGLVAAAYIWWKL